MTTAGKLDGAESTKLAERAEGADFLDLGCSRGGSIEHCVRRFGASRGLGIDVDPGKVEGSTRRGIDAVVGDATALGLEKQVRFVSMMHFLEHLPSLDDVGRAIASAAEAATDFLYIHHPSFEGEPYLGSIGLRQYWWHWKGHPTHITVADYCRIFEELGIGPYAIRYVERVVDSTHPSVLPADAPVDQFDYDPELHGPKPRIEFDPPLWRFQELFISLRPLPTETWAEIVGSATDGD